MRLLKIIRNITEDLDNCTGYHKTEDINNVVIVFRFLEPVDKITWELNKTFYEKYIKNLLIAEEDKFIPHEALTNIKN